MFVRCWSEDTCPAHLHELPNMPRSNRTANFPNFAFHATPKLPLCSECIYVVSAIVVRTHSSMACSKYPNRDYGFETPPSKRFSTDEIASPLGSHGLWG